MAVARGPRVALISLEPWDEVWRRNQYLSRSLIDQGLVEHLTFVEPPARAVASRREQDRLTVLTPRLRAPKRAGGLRLLGYELRRELAGADVLWVNDPTLGVHCLRVGQPALYDVTDDWRHAQAPRRIVRRIIRAEDQLARRARTVVCSPVLRDRWRERYGVRAVVVPNGIDPALWADPVPVELPGPAPHIGYIGTLHEERIDVELLDKLVNTLTEGTVHLVGPRALSGATEARIGNWPRTIQHGPVPADEVPGYMVAMDALIAPHVVSPFTLSLDAIKAYEYLAAGRPVIATPTSGFQHVRDAAVTLASADDFITAVRREITQPLGPLQHRVGTWDDRALLLAAVLGCAP